METTTVTPAFSIKLIDADTAAVIWSGPSDEFLSDNDDDPELKELLSNLNGPGDKGSIGGGASPEMIVRRI